MSKIKIVKNEGVRYLCDTTIGKIYDVTHFTEAGDLDSCGVVATYDSLNFIDDVGDNVAIWVHNDLAYELVDEGVITMINNNEHWNTVDWSQIPEDVEAVVTFRNNDPLTYYKMVDGVLMCECYRGYGFDESGYSDMEDLSESFNDRFHLRPILFTQPTLKERWDFCHDKGLDTPEPPESTQVESSQGEGTSVPEFDWSTVEDDVEAVILSPSGGYRAGLKESGNILYIKNPSRDQWYVSRRSRSIKNYPVKRFQEGDSKIVIRPPATPPLDKVTYPSVPSIQSILSDAQELIKKHHNITGEVKFTIKCN